MQDYETLIAEHDRLDMLAARLSEMACGAADAEGILAVRTDLSIALEDHLSREDSFLYEELLTRSGKQLQTAVSDFKSSFADLTADWSDYLRTWDLECILADRPSFAAETMAIMARLRLRIAQENSLLYPLALHTGRIRLRAA